MSAADYLLSVSRGRPGLIPGALRLGLSALAPVYCAGLEAYLLPYRLGIRKRLRLPCPVISIGNLTTGGTGKTPMTQLVCRQLQARGLCVAVLIRGYGGQHERGCALVSDGKQVLLSAREAGDEAALLAQSLPGVPIVTGKDRRVTGKLAWERFAPDVIVLDDGLQFWQLHRELDIVLLNACEPFDNGWTFPRGLLREPPSHLRRAGIVVLTNARRAGPERTAALRATVNHIAPNRPIFTADLIPTGLRVLCAETVYPVSWLEGRRVAALSAIGNPASFESLLEELGAIVVRRFRFPDHQALTPADLHTTLAHAREAGTEAILTTEKDAIKMPSIHTEMPLLALQVAMMIDRETEFVERLIDLTQDLTP
ncbi:MAG TPA: tetraacyldisaccharide 4'-kinase [Chthonomonadaceae bacterium]|nr:tetraacyldisaccharide 4'-kinase [Chthonomonadaceae bacterium]